MANHIHCMRLSRPILISVLFVLSGCASKPLSSLQREALTDYQVCRYMYTSFQRASDSFFTKETAQSYFDEMRVRRLDCSSYESQIRDELSRIAAENAAAFRAIWGITTGAAAASQSSSTNCTVIKGPITSTVTCY